MTEKIIANLETDLAIGTRADAASAAAGASIVSLVKQVLDSIGSYEAGDIVDVLGALDDAAASGVVTEVDTVMAYIKQLVTGGISRDTIIGALDDAAAAGAVTDADTLMAYMKQVVTELQVVDGYFDVPTVNGTDDVTMRDVVGRKTDAAAAGAVSTTESLMAYIKQAVTEGIARDLVIGKLDTAAATGAVTDADLIMAYIKQLVTEGIARDTAIGVIDGFHDVPTADVDTNANLRDVVGNKADAAATGAVTEVESLVAYIKQLVGEGIERDAVLGARDNALATGAVTNLDTAMSYIKQIVTELQVVDGYLDVPVADVATNATIRDVVGNKEDAAAAGAVSAVESLMAYVKQIVTEGIARDIAIGVIDGLFDVPTVNGTDDVTVRDVVGRKTDAAAAGAVSTTESLMAYAKQLVTEGIARDAVIAVLGAVNTAAASGAVTDADLIMAYVKQLVTEGIARDAVVGTQATAAATGAVSEAKALMAYVKQLVTEGIARDAVIGALNTAAATGAVTDADLMMAYVKQLVTEGIARDIAIGIIDGLFDVPTVNGTADATMRDVVGKKEDAAAAGAVSTTESLVAYAKQTVTEGIARDTAIGVIDGLVDSSGTITIVKSITSSDIPDDGGGTPLAAPLTGAASGNLLLEEIVMQTDGTGLAGPTTVQVVCDNVKGLTGATVPVWDEATANLGANTHINNSEADTNELPMMLESGKKLYINGDSTLGTGAGVVDVIMKFRRMTANSTIAAA